ncbi:MAG: CAP domain-containing protein [Bacillota bacterium]|nr:CAP domain-containing protein [Bacillota bacterium]
MNRKKIGLAIFTVAICLGLMFVFACIMGYGSVDCSSSTVGEKVLEDGNVEEPVEKTVDWPALIFADDKETREEPGEKVRPEPEPEPEPEKEPEGNPEEPVTARDESTEGQEPAATAPSSEVAASPTGLSIKEQQMFALLNEARKNSGLSALQYSSKLTGVARAKSNDMVDHNYFGHVSPVYGDLGSILSRFGVSYRAAGENLAMNSNGSVSAAHNALLGSSPHRANMLNGNYNSVGIGIAVGGDGCHYYTQIFTGN